jgi:uncharacterized LabA/DUF88 family protein
MESEHDQFPSPQPEQGAQDTQDAAYTAPEGLVSDQESVGEESSQDETSGSSRHRRRRPPRGGARHSHADSTEQGGEAAEQEEQSAERVSQDETPQMSAEVAEAPGSAEATTPPRDTWRTETETQAPAPAELTWGFQGWYERPSADWNPFLPRTAEAQPATNASGSSDMTSDFETATLSSTATETSPEGEEVIASIPVQEPTPETSAEQSASEQAGEASRETIRAPLSGVEVRPPRRYRFDRPSQTPRHAAHAQPAAQQGGQTSEAPRAAEATGKGREAAPAADKEGGMAASGDHRLGETIEREMTETPEIEADVEAAEDLARATQAALEEEVAEALESFTAATEQTPAPRTGRRRRRRSGPPAAAAAPSAGVSEPAEKSQPPAPQPMAPLVQAPQPYVAPAPQPYQIANGLQQLGQPQSPFAGPEPSSARGFGPVPRGVAMPAERGVRLPRPERTVETGNVSANQLAMIFTQAIQQQTDRLLMELRRSQGTPSMTVNFPPMPSTERIGVFVDVANLLYSARNMRIAIDFGRLLDFLRGNRRLVRAHAYCPTSPDPRAEQMFLDAVKGLGYRITTKNYKTFSSGAKKADLDLDLCMDIVRLVDAGSVDCISLVSGDSDFLPLLEYCSDHGVRVEVAAFDEATASILRQSCDLFINLSMVEEIRA